MLKLLLAGYEVQVDEERDLEDYNVDWMEKLQEDPGRFVEFFQFYSDFDFDEEIISPFYGQALDKGAGFMCVDRP